MFDVLGVGTNSADEVLVAEAEVDSLLTTGKVRATGRSIVFGGQTATVTAACAALGLRSRYVGAFGSDAHGRLAREALAARGVDVERSVECDAPNRGAVILVGAGGRRVVLWHRDDRLVLPADLPEDVWAARVVHVDDDMPELALRVAAAARKRGVPVTSDIEHPAPAVEPLIAAVSHPILEQSLPERITGERDPERALRKLRRLNPGPLCITLGERGAVALDGDRFYESPAFRVPVVDTTGAGDVFRAGFIYGLLRGWQMPQLLRFANAAAAVSCTRLGAIPSVPTLQEVEDLSSIGDRPSSIAGRRDH